MYSTLLVRYGEIGLKGKNRWKFEERLIDNIRMALRDIPHGPISKSFGRVYIETGDEWPQVVEALKKVFGIVSISPVLKRPLDLDEIKEGALQVYRRVNPQTFKVNTKRPNKGFYMKTPELNQELGGYILTHHPEARVDVHNPEAVIYVEIRSSAAYVYSEVIPCLGGLPVGSANKGLLLLSGGIDSPVGGFLSMKRGIEVEGLHFHSYPFTSEQSRQKVIELARIISEYNLDKRFNLWVCPFTEIQKALQKNPYPDLKITLMRRMMLRVAAKLAAEKGHLALITGENLGQVASQTMESLYTINAVTSMPILRPLISMDKQEIVDIARKIGTYETSILPYEDCCTVFVPKNPATRPTIAKAEEAEEHLDVPALVDEAVAKTELVEISHKVELNLEIF